MPAPIRHASSASILAVTLLLSGCAQPKPAPLPVATVAQPCPPWALFPEGDHSNADARYFGCVSNENLRAMVADPADLDGGRPLGPAPGDVQSSAIEAYQQGKVKAFEGTSASGASSSGGSGSP